MQDNEEQMEYWNGAAGETWVRAQARLDEMLAPISRALVDRAGVQAGERVLDVGCGCGDTSLMLAGRGAGVHGVDISEPMLALARERARGLPDADLRFTCADAAAHAFSADHDLLVSRFGVMFFADPIAAFANLRRALGPDGRLCFVCWQAPRANPWISVTGAAIAPFLEPPAEAPDPRAPGPFAFAEVDWIEQVLAGAGFGEVVCEALQTKLHLADDLDAALEFQGEIGPVARALSELEGEARAGALEAARGALAAHLTDDGLELGASCWVVSALG